MIQLNLRLYLKIRNNSLFNHLKRFQYRDHTRKCENLISTNMQSLFEIFGVELPEKFAGVRIINELIYDEKEESLLIQLKKSPPDGYYWLDGLLYHEPETLITKGKCGPNSCAEFELLTGTSGIDRIIDILNDIADNNTKFAIDFETGPCKKAPVNKETGEFDLSRLGYSIQAKQNGSDPHTSTVFLMAISTEPRFSYVVDIRECINVGGDKFKKALARSCKLGLPIAHNFSFEWRFIKAITGEDAICYFDTMIATQVLYAGLPDPALPWNEPFSPPRLSVSLSNVLFREMGMKLDKTVRSLFLYLHPDTGLTNEQIAYVAGDTGLLLELTNILEDKLWQKQLHEVYFGFEAPLIPIASKIMYEGALIDINLVLEFQKEALRQKEEIEVRWNERNPDISISSNLQLKNLFQRKYPNANISGADEKILSDLANRKKDEDAGIILEYRKVEKVEGTYLKPFVETHRNPITGNMHCDLKQSEAKTSRMSVSAPPLHQIPSKGPWAAIRKCFIARPGYKLVDCDLSQFEVRALADMANETGMIDFFIKSKQLNDKIREHKKISGEDDTYQELLKEKEKLDFHTLNAKALFKDSFINGTDEQKIELRKKAKALSFGIPYGVGPKKVSEDFGISKYEAQDMINTYYRTWRKIEVFLNKCKFDGVNKGYVADPTGRKRFFSLPKKFKGVLDRYNRDSYDSMKWATEREAGNSPVQSINSQSLKKAAILMKDDLERLNSRFILFVHDEILVEAPDEHAEEVAQIMNDRMIEAAKQCGLVKVPIEVSYTIDDHWNH